MPQIPAAIPTQAFELIRNRIAEILVDELPSQATFAGDPKLNATVYVERSIMFDLSELPAVNVSVGRTAYSEQTQRNTDGEHTFTIDVHTSAKSTSTVRGDSLAAFRLQKLLGVCRGILEDSRYKTLGFAPPFIESRKVTAIEYAQPTDGDGTSSVQGRITFVVRAPDRNGVVTPELIAGYDTQVKLGLTEKGYIFTGDNIPVPPIVGAEISINGTFYIEAEAGDEVDIPVLNSEGDAVGTVTPSVGVEVPDATYTLIDTDVPPNTLDSGSIASGAAATIVAPAASVTVNTAPFGTAPSGGALNVPVLDSALNPRGSKIGANWRIADSLVTINTLPSDAIVSEQTYALTVTRDSLPYSPSYNPATNTLNVDSAPCVGGSVAVAVSDATPSFGQSITITATPSGFTPTSYVFFAFDGSQIEFIAEQAGNAANWIVSLTGVFDIYVLATDGTVSAYGSTSLVGTSSLILDSIATPALFAISFARKLRVGYTGDAMLVRRSSDSTQLSIGFVGEAIDTAALTAFVGVGNGFTAVVYDQVGSNSPFQNTAGSQPSIVVSGVVQMLGGKPTALFNGTSSQMSFPSSITFAHGFSVHKKNATTNNAQFIIGGANVGFGSGGTLDTGVIRLQTLGGSILTATNNLLPHQCSFRCGVAGTGRIRVDGVTQVNGTTSASVVVSVLGSESTFAVHRHNGQISEIILYSSPLSDADELIIENNQRAYYGL